MLDAKQLRLPFPEKQLLLPLTDLVDVIDLNADESITVYANPDGTFDAERPGQFWDGDNWYNNLLG